MSGPQLEQWRLVLCALLGILYLVAGVMHLIATDGFVAIVPPWVPEPALVVVVTGLLEIAAAIGLFIPRVKTLAGGMLALYALCVFPANLHHAINDIPAGGVHLGWWYHGPRLAFQPILIWSALFAVALVDWPFGGTQAGRRTS